MCRQVGLTRIMVSENSPMTRHCRKPDLICKILPDLERLSESGEIAHFAEVEKKSIEKRISALGLKLRLATRQDIDAIQEFQARRFPKGTLLEDAYVLFRIIRFGYAPLIESVDGRIVACNLCEGYDDSDRTLWGIRNSVDPSVSGANLAAELANYSNFIGIQRGSRFRRAFVAPSNLASVANLLNHVGFIAESLDLNVPGHHGPRFVLVMPLTPAGVKNNRIDLEKMRRFMDTHRAGRDYVTLAASDLDGLVGMYSRTSFRVVAFLKADQDRGEHAFFALPADSLGLPEST
jgi:hypothetical protein